MNVDPCGSGSERGQGLLAEVLSFYFLLLQLLLIVAVVGDATVATVLDHCETVVEVLLGGDLRPVDTRQDKLQMKEAF